MKNFRPLTLSSSHFLPAVLYSRVLFSVAAIFAMSSKSAAAGATAVRVEIVKAAPANVKVTKSSSYDAHVTLSIEAADGKLTPSGWSTIGSAPFSFQPGVGLIQGWTDGVLQMREGERALIHVPSALGYGAPAQGSKGGAWYIPGSSDLLFDIEILGKKGASSAAKEL